MDVISRMSHLFDLLKISRIVSCILIPAPIFRPHSGHGHVHIHESMGGMLLIQVPHVCLHASLYLQFIDCIINICLLICVYVGVRSSNLLIGGEAASVSMNRKVDRQPVHFAPLELCLALSFCLPTGGTTKVKPGWVDMANAKGFLSGQPNLYYFPVHICIETWKVYPDEKGSEVDLLAPAP